jgi:hypothetical protein
MTTLARKGYPYQPLNRTTDEIRLLTLSYPSMPATPLPIIPNAETEHETDLPPCNFTLTHASLATNPPPRFTALSYVWGDPTRTHRLPLPVPSQRLADPSHNGTAEGIQVHMQITYNLHTALTRLRRQRWAGSLWVDALCINQGDIQEKNVQVPLMSRIYRSAERVLVWLGPEED